jgi:hypothetical protein
MVGMKSVGKLPTIRRTRILGTPNLAKLPGHYHARAPLPRRRHRRKKGGLVTYLEVVTAQSAALTNDRTAVQILTQRMNACVLLIKALGGGWNVSNPPQVSGHDDLPPRPAATS